MNPRDKNENRARKAKHTRKHLNTHPVLITAQNRTADRIRRQPTNRRNKEDDSRAETNLLQGRNLRDQRPNQRDIRTATETKQRGKRNDPSRTGARDPERENPYPRQRAHRHKDVVPADPVAHDAGEQPPEETGRVENRKQVLHQVGVHACVESLHGEVIDGDEDAKREAEEAGAQEDKIEFGKGLGELRLGELLRTRWVRGPDGEVGDDEEREDEERADSHGPGEADFADEAGYRDGEDDAAEGGARCEDAECCAAFLVEPPVDDVYC